MGRGKRVVIGQGRAGCVGRGIRDKRGDEEEEIFFCPFSFFFSIFRGQALSSIVYKAEETAGYS